MTALLIICIVFCGIVALFDVVCMFSDDALAGLGFLNLLPIMMAIVTLSITLGVL